MATRTEWRAEISRKALHIASVLIPIAYGFLSRPAMIVALSACLVVAIAIEVLRQTQPHFAVLFKRTVGFMVRSAEWRRVCGATYVLAGALLAVLLFPKTVAIAGLLILGISDSAASLVGLRFGRTQFLGKSLAGSLAFFATALAILWVLFPEARGVAFAAAIVATLSEALPAIKFGPLELNDNVTIPLLTGTATCLLLRLA